MQLLPSQPSSGGSFSKISKVVMSVETRGQIENFHVCTSDLFLQNIVAVAVHSTQLAY